MWRSLVSLKGRLGNYVRHEPHKFFSLALPTERAPVLPNATSAGLRKSIYFPYACTESALTLVLADRFTAAGSRLPPHIHSEYLSGSRPQSVHRRAGKPCASERGSYLSIPAVGAVVIRRRNAIGTTTALPPPRTEICR